MDVNPYQALGVASSASATEVTVAYRTMAQIFHPDRYATAPEAVRLEAERRMKELNEAYDFARKASPAQVRLVHTAHQRERTQRKKASQSTNMGVPWEVAQRERAEQSRAAAAARLARERAAHNGRAIPRRKPAMPYPNTLAGLGEALHTNNVVCRRCRSIEWLPAGWTARLDDTDFFCSVCDRLLLSRRFA